MKKLILFIALAATIICCSTDNSLLSMDKIRPHDKPLLIATRILCAESLSFVQEFTKGSVIGMHVTNGRVGDLYNHDIRNNHVRVEATSITHKQISWQQTPSVLLDPHPATIYAYYPYQPQANFSPTAIPIYISPNAHLTNDYMYGTHAIGQKAVTSLSPTTLLTMKHALSLISFHLSLTKGMQGTFTLSSVQLGNKAGGNALFGKGFMDITSGVITRSMGINTSTRLTMEAPISLAIQSASALQIKVIPTDRVIKAEEVEALFSINGTTYKFTIPAQTSWNKGRRYLYHLCFNGQSLRLNKVSVSTWIPEDHEDNLSCN